MGTNNGYTWRATVVTWNHLGEIPGRTPDATVITLKNRLGFHYIVLKGSHLWNKGTKVTILQSADSENIILVGEGFDGFEKVLWERNLRKDPTDWGYKIDHPVEDCEIAGNRKCTHWGHFFTMPYWVRAQFAKNPEEATCVDPETGEVFYHPWALPNGWGFYQNGATTEMKPKPTKIEGVEVTVLWNGGVDIYIVDPNSIRDLTEDEKRDWFTGNARYFPSVDDIWLKGSFLDSASNQAKIAITDSQCVRILANIASHD